VVERVSVRILDGVLYLSAHDEVHGQEPWRSDGTVEGTGMLADVNPGSGSSAPLLFTRFSDKLLFTAENGVHGRELWESGID
jgi:ELWxxDGT repeat protein